MKTFVGAGRDIIPEFTFSADDWQKITEKLDDALFIKFWELASEKNGGAALKKDAIISINAVEPAGINGNPVIIRALNEGPEIKKISAMEAASKAKAAMKELTKRDATAETLLRPGPR